MLVQVTSVELCSHFALSQFSARSTVPSTIKSALLKEILIKCGCELAVEFDYSGSYLAVGGSDIRYIIPSISITFIQHLMLKILFNHFLFISQSAQLTLQVSIEVFTKAGFKC